MNSYIKLFGTGMFVAQLSFGLPTTAAEKGNDVDTSHSIPPAAVLSGYGSIDVNDDSVTTIPIAHQKDRKVVGNEMYRIKGITTEGSARVHAAGQNVEKVLETKDITAYAIISAENQPYNPEKIPGNLQP